MASNDGRYRTNVVLDRAFAAGTALCIGAAAVTGIFISKIVHASASAATGGSTSDSGGQTGPGLPSDGSSINGGQLSVPPQNQPPLGGSHGS